MASYAVLQGDGTDAHTLDGSIFSGIPSVRQAVVRTEEMEDGVLYRIEVTVSSASQGWSVSSSVNVETNAPPSTGYLESDITSIRLLSQGSGLTMSAKGWTDDASHMPLTYRFGYYKLPLAASEAAAAGSLSSNDIMLLLNRESGSEFVPLHRGFTSSSTLGNVTLSPIERARHALVSAPGVA